MKKKYFLPITDPKFIRYPYETYANAILSANAQEQTHILMGANHINCFFNDESKKHKLNISIYDQWCADQKIIQFQSIDLFKEVYKKENINLIIFIKKCIFSNYYVFGRCNRTYIENGAKSDAPLFDYVILGFDDIKHEFMICGLDSTENFLCCKIDYNKFIEALYDTPICNIALTMRRYKSELAINFDLPNIIFQLEDYINSTNSRKQYTAGRIYGLAAFEKLSQYFDQCAQNEEKILDRYFQYFATHKYYMKKRIECLISHNVISSKWISYAENVENIGQDVLKLGMEYNESGNRDLIKILTLKILETIKIEREYLPYVLIDLGNFKDK